GRRAGPAPWCRPGHGDGGRAGGRAGAPRPLPCGRDDLHLRGRPEVPGRPHRRQQRLRVPGDPGRPHRRRPRGPGGATVSWDYGTVGTEVYEIDKPIGHSFGNVEYYTGLLAGTSGRILEPAVGTGRILIPLLEAGREVEGLDTSPQMLAVCRQHCRDRGLDPV